MEGKLRHIAPVILAGGMSSRMGRNKSFVTIGENKLIEVVIGKIAETFESKPLIVTNSQEEYRYLGLPMVSDIYPGMGPLGGIHAALMNTTLDYVFVFACDMPFVEGGLIRHMAGLAPGFDIVMPLRGADRPEPLHAIYSRNCLGAIEERLKMGQGRVVAFFDDVNVRYLDEAEIRSVVGDDEIFLNINTPAELEKGRKIWFNR